VLFLDFLHQLATPELRVLAQLQPTLEVEPLLGIWEPACKSPPQDFCNQTATK